MGVLPFVINPRKKRSNVLMICVNFGTTIFPAMNFASPTWPSVKRTFWSEREQKIEFVARMYGPTLAEGFRRDLEKKKIYGNSD